MKVAVKVMPRKEVLDMQGRAVEGLLKQNGMSVDGCQIGKYIVLDIPNAKTSDDAKLAAKKMAEFVLYNPLIESFELEVIT